MCRVIVLLAMSVALSASQADALVTFQVLPKGTVRAESQWPKELAPLLTKVRPIRGELTEAFSFFDGLYDLTLYYRGVHQDIQELLDGLAKLEHVTVVARINESGEVGKITSRRMFKVDKPIPYLYRVHVHRSGLMKKLETVEFRKRMMISVEIFSGGDIDPKRLKIPEAINQRSRPLMGPLGD